MMEGERSGMASTGGGSGGSARQREAGDSKSVSDAAGRGGYGAPAGGGMAGGGMADIPGNSGTSGGASGSSAEAGSEAGGGGEQNAKGEFEGGDLDESDRDGAMVGNIPEDIPADGSGDDQVARQLREAAMAEQDPDIREALWDEYRKQMSIK